MLLTKIASIKSLRQNKVLVQLDQVPQIAYVWIMYGDTEVL